MTSGSSQGLFVIVAVIIFGIFVAISYLLFRDKLQTGLASIFGDTIYSAESALNPNLVKNFGESGYWIASDGGSLTKYAKEDAPKSEELPSETPNVVLRYAKNDKYKGGTLTYKITNAELGLNVGDTVEVSALVYLPKKYDSSYISIGSWDIDSVSASTWINAQLTNTSSYEGGKWFRYKGKVKINNDLKKTFVVGVTLKDLTSEQTEIYIADYQIKKVN